MVFWRFLEVTAQQEPVGIPQVEHCLPQDQDLLGIALSAAQHEVITFLPGHVPEHLEQLGEEGVINLVDDHTEEMSTLSTQGTSAGIGSVAQLPSGPPHSLAGFLADGNQRLGSTQHARDSALGYTAPQGHIPDGDYLTGHKPSSSHYLPISIPCGHGQECGSEMLEQTV